MQYKNVYDVTIVGAGPAGAVLAYLLASQGVNVLIIEREMLPRYKPCGGGLTRKVFDVLPFDVAAVVEDISHTAVISVDNQTIFQKTLDEPILKMVMRDRFDHFLVQKAIDAGAIIHEGVTFKSLSGIEGDLSLETTNVILSGIKSPDLKLPDETVRTKILVAADGVNSTTAKALGLINKNHLSIALEAEVFLKEANTLQTYQNSVYFDFGVIPGGYGWIFPKAHHLSIGVMSTSKKIRGLKHHLTDYLKTKNLLDQAGLNTVRGHFIPYLSNKKSVLANSKGLLVGDATGFTDPVTGEGIYFAVKGASIAADVIVNALKHDLSHLTQYTPLLKAEFQKELTYARRLGYLLYHFPKLSHKALITHGEKLGSLHLNIISGRKTYEEMYQEMLSHISSFPRRLRSLFR